MEEKLPLIALLCILLSGITTAQTTILSQNFESGMAGWTTVANTGDSIWEIKTNPFPEPSLGSLTFHSATPTHFAIMISDGDTSAVNTDLVSPVINCSGTSHIALKFYQWFNLYSAANTSATVSVSNNGSTWTQVYNALTSSSQTNPEVVLLDISSIAGNQATVYVKFSYGAKNDNFWAVDDISIGGILNTDAALGTITPIVGSNRNYGAVGGNVNLGGTIFNYGEDPITSCVVKWTDGTNVYPDTLSMNIAFADSFAFTHSQPYPVSGLGNFPVTMWVELAGDTVYSNDTLATSITGVGFMPAHKVVIEDQTICATGFGIYCPRGIVMKDSFARSSMSDFAEMISVHGNYSAPPNDAMYDSVYATGAQNLLSGMSWPEVQVDRTVAGDPNQIFNLFNEYSPDFGVADIGVYVSYDTIARALSVTATAHFAVAVSPATGRYNLALVLTEDSVHGTDSTYAQRNAYTGNSMGPMAGAGIDFAAQPDPVPASLMYYMNVARSIDKTYTGTNGSVPLTVAADSTVGYTFPTDTIPAAWNEAKMHAIVMLVNTTTHQIRNANDVPLIPVATGISEVQQGQFAFNVFPNPFNDEANLVFNLDKPGNVTLRVADMPGQTVSVYEAGMMASGEHSIILNGKYLSPGVYLVTLSGSNGTSTKKVVVNK